jgi:glyoxylase-like metal-dependent hydrolase (beta-lactamase superfamily II)
VYFLTHFHTDHMDGLTEGWDRGPLYCSDATAQLLLQVRKVSQKVVRKRPIDVSFHFTDPLTQMQLTATLVDADHCPGSVMVVLEGFPNGAVVHTGDFRFHRGLCSSEALRRVADSKRCAQLYLDTSWAHEAFQELPTKETSKMQLLDLIDRFPSEAIVLHSHGLGDEELLAAVACQFPNDRLLFADSARLEELRIAVPELDGLSRFALFNSADPSHRSKSQRFFVIKNADQKRKLGLEGIEVSCSTLWWAKAVRNEVQSFHHPVRDPRTGAWHVLWAMHSSLGELQEFVSWLQPQALDGICPVICHEDSPSNPLNRFLGLLSTSGPERSKHRWAATHRARRTACADSRDSPDLSSPDSAESTAIRCKVLASTSAYRAELLRRKRAEAADASAFATVPASASGGSEPTDHSAGRSPGREESDVDTLLTLFTDVADNVEQVPPTQESCPTTEKDDSSESVELDSSDIDCPDTEIEEDSGEIDVNLARERLSCSTEQSQPAFADLLDTAMQELDVPTDLPTDLAGHRECPRAVTRTIQGWILEAQSVDQVSSQPQRSCVDRTAELPRAAKKLRVIGSLSDAEEVRDATDQ